MSSSGSTGFFTPADYQIEHGLIKRVYDLSYYGYDLIFNTQDMQPNTLTNVVNSATATTFKFAQTASSPIRGNNPCLLSNKDSLVLAGPTAKTDLDVKLEITPDMDALVHEVNLYLPFGLNIDTYDSGSPTINSVTINCFYENDSTPIPQLTNTFTPAFTALSAAGTQVFVVNVTINPYGLVLLKGKSVIMELKTACNFGTGNTTGHAGLFQDCSYGKQISPAAPIYYYPASAFFHVHPTTSHVNPQLITGQYTP